MAYDAENRMKSAEFTDSGGTQHRTDYAWSGDNLLAEMKKYQNGALTQDTRYIRAGFLPIQERDAANAITREYTWGLNLGGGIGGLLNLRYGGNDYAYLYDGKGNVSALVDGAQAVAAAYAYDPFGVLVRKAGTLDQRYQFSTKEYDIETGLSRYDYRFYMPALAKWITRDPIEEVGGVNLYGFVGSNAVNYYDPLGLIWPLDCIDCVSAKNKLQNAVKECQRELDKCPDADAMDEFVEKYKGGGSLAGAVLNCAKMKLGPDGWQALSESCYKCSSPLSGPKPPIKPR